MNLLAQWPDVLLRGRADVERAPGSNVTNHGSGLIGTAVPVAWWTWLAKVLPDDAEAGGGLVAVV
ncbi:hypothetical protein [Arenibaculum pallidiluteum]|uniref:hypothetical protein n=1 Tax=Arenibaculum pallidiluteum TaxID=2812559 RepID=UPI001A961AD0|nr:hypothetical protein [Arenibaculum pallidiluteum]